MEIETLIGHPEMMDRETLYDLRSMLALYPYYQTARLLMLQNLYLLHDPSFDEELHRAAIYITDRKKIFELVEAVHYRMKTAGREGAKGNSDKGEKANGDRTSSLIDRFLGSLPQEGDDDKREKRKPTRADATVDYVAYLMETEGEDRADTPKQGKQMRGQQLIDDFINKSGGKIELHDEPEQAAETPQTAETGAANGAPEAGDAAGKEYYTETLARIYIKQGNYMKAKEIIENINLTHRKKSIYFADQMRFLEKLIINSNKKQ